MGANGLTHDSTTCIKVSQSIRLNAHLRTVKKLASIAGNKVFGIGNWPVNTTHVRIRKRKAVSQQANKLGQSMRLPTETTFRMG